MNAARCYLAHSIWRATTPVKPIRAEGEVRGISWRIAPVTLARRWRIAKTGGMRLPPIPSPWLPLGALLLTMGCAGDRLAARDPQAAFMARLGALCGKAFAGRIVASVPAGADDVMAGKPMVMHVRGCSAGRIEIPFHVGDDRSRTWVITQTPDGLRLKHDHRHEDGSADKLTMYGGDTGSRGTAGQQRFPVDAESIASFRANGLDRSVTNVWTLTLSDPRAAAPRFTYELQRPAGPAERLFRVEFDLSRQVAAPPKPWGW